MKTQNLSIEALKASESTAVGKLEERLNKADEDNKFVIEQTEAMFNSIKGKSSYLENKIKQARKNKENLER